MPVGDDRRDQVDPVHHGSAEDAAVDVGVLRQDELRHLRDGDGGAAAGKRRGMQARRARW